MTDEGGGGVHHRGVDARGVADAKAPPGADENGVGGDLRFESEHGGRGGDVAVAEARRAFEIDPARPTLKGSRAAFDRGGVRDLIGELAARDLGVLRAQFTPAGDERQAGLGLIVDCRLSIVEWTAS